ncbi:MAG: hypothetical protein ACRCYP_02300, partial [Alphaproteobacteria bacterium]
GMARFKENLKRKKLKTNDKVGFLKKIRNGVWEFRELKVKSVTGKKAKVAIDGIDKEFDDEGIDAQNPQNSLEPIPAFVSQGLKVSPFVRNALSVGVIEINEAVRENIRYANALN